MTAQVLSIVAFLISFGDVFTFFLGLVAMILLQCVWCCRLNKCALNTAACFAVAVSVLDFSFAIYIFVQGSDVCGDGFSEEDDCYWEVGATLLIISAALWVAVALLVFSFANSARFTKCWEESDPDFSPAAARPFQTSTMPVMAKSTNDNNAPISTTETTEYPDGTIKHVTTTVDQYGNKTVTESVEQQAVATTLQP